MSLKTRYELPARAADTRQLGEMTGAACAVETASIIEQHDGPVILVTRDMQNALRLRDEIRQFTALPQKPLPTGKPCRMTVFRRTRRLSPTGYPHYTVCRPSKKAH